MISARGQRATTLGPADTVVVACCQLAPTLRDPAANRERVADAVSHAVSLGARIVVLPELVSSGYVFEDRVEAAACAEPADGVTLNLWARLAARLQPVLSTVSVAGDSSVPCPVAPSRATGSGSSC